MLLDFFLEYSIMYLTLISPIFSNQKHKQLEVLMSKYLVSNPPSRRTRYGVTTIMSIICLLLYSTLLCAENNSWSSYISNLVQTTDSLALKLFFVLILGLLLSLTPCIYPM